MAYLNRAPAKTSPPVKIGLIGSGWMGAFHAESIARRVPGAELAAIADPNVDSAAALASALGTAKVTADAADILADPEIDAVIIASPARFHAQLIGQAAAAGKHVFCEKPAGQGLDELDAALAAVTAAGVHFQIGFNRRYAADFQAAKKDLAAGTAGTPQLLRSLTRDPGTGSILHAARVPAWTVFLETLIHDFDTLNWFNEGAEPVEVYAVADRLGGKYGVTFCIENLNTILDHPGIPLARAKDTLALVQASGHPNARLMLDLYHAQMGEGNLIELVRSALPYLGEIQVADVPGRCEPGTGEINYAAVARALTDAGYDGTVGMEAWASGDSQAALDAFRAAFTVSADRVKADA